MTDKEQREVLYRHYWELEEDKKNLLVLVGKKLLTINSLVRDGELPAVKNIEEGEDVKSPVWDFKYAGCGRH